MCRSVGSCLVTSRIELGAGYLINLFVMMADQVLVKENNLKLYS
jgi:hypothetical protein